MSEGVREDSWREGIRRMAAKMMAKIGVIVEEDMTIEMIKEAVEREIYI